MTYTEIKRAREEGMGLTCLFGRVPPHTIRYLDETPLEQGWIIFIVDFLKLGKPRKKNFEIITVIPTKSFSSITDINVLF